MTTRSIGLGAGRVDAGARRCPSTGRKARAFSSAQRVTATPVRAQAAATSPAVAQAEDVWIAKNIQSAVATPPQLQGVTSGALEALRTLRMPTNRNEEYRFTDLAALTSQALKPAAPGADVDATWLASLALPEGTASLAVVVDGVLRPSLCRGLSNLPHGIFIGSIQDAPQELLAQHLGAQSASRGGPFSVLNSATLQDVLCVLLPDSTAMQQPLHVLYVSTGSSTEGELSSSAPRMLLVAGRNATADVVEEYVSSSSASSSSSSGRYFTNSVAEMVLGQDAVVTHAYVQREAEEAVHVRCTLVSQAQGSSYNLTQASLGGTLSRHDLGIQQDGEATNTDIRHFLLVGGPGQLGDLHSRLELNHPHGVANQLHKCIVVQPTGRGVFDGNVKVNRRAQKSDAGQLSRNLLLLPRATVNVKPNLQIIADDVKCTHGCAVSDLSDEEIFYFQARGIPAAAARQSLVFSFGAEVMQRLRHKPLMERLQADVTRILQQQAAAVIGGPASS